jgi:3-oxoacyl-(acyl-carrier-protein) synthase
MNDPFLAAASIVTADDLPAARLGARFGRLDLCSQLALLAVEKLAPVLESLPRERTAVCLAARAGSLSTDVDYWNGRVSPGGPSPTLFAYTLPSAAIGEIAIRHRLTGPNLCFVGDGRELLAEAADLLRRREADACVCVSCNALTPAAAAAVRAPAAARACALLLVQNGADLPRLREFHRDMESLCAIVAARKSVG